MTKVLPMLLSPPLDALLTLLVSHLVVYLKAQAALQFSQAHLSGVGTTVGRHMIAHCSSRPENV